jgi:hypothetical protein
MRKKDRRVVRDGVPPLSDRVSAAPYTWCLELITHFLSSTGKQMALVKERDFFVRFQVLTAVIWRVLSSGMLGRVFY